MPRKLDNDTRIHFRTYEDEAHAQKRAFCLHCNKDACADNIQRMKNHLTKCEAYLNSSGSEPSFAFDLDGPIAPDTPMAGMTGPSAIPEPANGGDTAAHDPSLTANPSMAPPPSSGTSAVIGTPSTASSTAPSAAMMKASQDSLNKVRTAMARSTKRLESLEAVLKTQIQDGMHNAATHVRAAIRDERDRLFKLSQTLVKQEMKIRDAQTAMGVPM
ncbi:ino80 chromatin remodeling complex [Diaporthe amygdali]|uniref:ino80 chromatin remodeling complex n=1 Tax=Phomopsis amygdali TaxID=1214568 RepID=UPI0022FE0163|nr:ino80 chromatin remodeling complex [Diaporthe amygdali]KAJ0118717.1 ino80 chromatin remodeling complex [Diaporthe amygdali]